MLRQKNNGFTLIEILIVVALIAVLSSLAYPNYTEYVARSKRSQMVATLMQAQQWMERFYTENYSYYQVRGSTAKMEDAFPAELKQSPLPTEGAANYQITSQVTATSPERYSLKATRAGSFAADRCGDYQIDQYARKTLTNFDTKKFANAKAALDYCWK